MNIIKLDNVGYQYRNGTRALKDVSLTINRGEFAVVLGPNGSGKSTLAGLLNGLLLPTEGRIFVDGLDTRENTYKIREKVGLIFQNPDNQVVATIIEEDVAFGPENLKMPPDEIRKKVEQALKDVGLWQYRFHASYNLSGGQKQKLAIAGVLALNPQVIILDEPLMYVDYLGRQEILTLIRRLNKEKGITVILITHDVEEALHSDKVIVLNNGRVEIEGGPEELISAGKRLYEFGLEMPFIVKLTEKLNEMGYNLPEKIYDIDGLVDYLCP